MNLIAAFVLLQMNRLAARRDVVVVYELPSFFNLYYKLNEQTKSWGPYAKNFHLGTAGIFCGALVSKHHIRVREQSTI